MKFTQTIATDAVLAGARDERHLSDLRGLLARATLLRTEAIDYEEAAAYLSTTPRHVRELWARRQLAAVKVGRCVRFTKGDLDAFIAANRVSVPGSTPSRCPAIIH